MAIVSVFSTGSGSSSSGTITLNWPASHAIDDVCVGMVGRDVAGAINTPSGFTALADTGLFGSGVTATGLQLSWRRATSTTEAAAVWNTSGNKFARLVTFRGCATTGSPFVTQSTGGNSTAATAYSQTGGTTTFSDLLMCYFMTQEVDTTTSPFINAGTAANANLASIVEQFAQSGTQGNGMGVGLVTGQLATAGDSGTLTATYRAASCWANVVLGIKSTTSSEGGGRNADPDFFNLF